MALLQFDKKQMVINVVAGLLETYAPSERVEKLQKQLTEARDKMIAIEKTYTESIQKEVMPTLQALETEIRDINEERYPQIKEMREKAEAEKAATQPPLKAVTPEEPKAEPEKK